MTIHPGHHLSPELIQSLGRLTGLPSLMPMARLRGEPSERALAAIHGDELGDTALRQPKRAVWWASRPVSRTLVTSM